MGLEEDILEEVPLALFNLMSMIGAGAGAHQELQGECKTPPGAGTEVGL